MSVIKDLRREIMDYATDCCDLKIVDVNFPGNVINENEEFTFKVRITNQDCLDMENVCVEVIGSEFVRVHKHFDKGSFDFTIYDAVKSEVFDLDAFQSYTSQMFHGYAKHDTGKSERKIVKARIFKWDASLHHLLIDQSSSGIFEGVLEQKIITG